MSKLISMRDYVLNQYKKRNSYYNQDDKVFLRTHNYAKFLSQPLHIGLFVPCDLDGNVLKEPDISDFDNGVGIEYDNFELHKKIYQQAKERVLFEGFKYHKNGYAYKDFDRVDEEFCEGKTIESLINEFDEIELTPTALKQIGLCQLN